MLDTENRNHGPWWQTGNDGCEAQPDRRLFQAWRARERISMPHNDEPNPDALAAVAEPKQCSRCAFFCVAVSSSSLPLPVGFIIITPVGELVVICFIGEALRKSRGAHNRFIHVI